MRNPSRWFVISALGLIALAAAVIFALVGRAPQSTAQPPVLGLSAEAVRGRVLDIMEEGETELGGRVQPYQILLVKLLDGPLAGKLVEIDYGLRQVRPSGLMLEVGDEVLVTVTEMPDGQLLAYFTDFVRTRPLLILFGAFVLTTVLVSGWKGVRSLLAMLFSLAVIIFYILPQILQGRDPVVVTTSGAFVLLAVTLYLTYGWRLKTHAAVLGTLATLALTALLASYFVNLTRLTGFGSEDALFLFQLSQAPLNLQGLVLGGMIIGALGVLDDLVTTQASAVFELYAAGERSGFWPLFRRAMRIGRDHVAATVNTLVLAYAGAALPALLLFSLSGENMAYLLNLEYVTEEVVRTLVGSLGLMTAAPLTTLLAVGLALSQERLLARLPWLVAGKESGAETDGHSHFH